MSISFARWVAKEDCIICCMRRAAWPPAQHLHHIRNTCDPVGTGAERRLKPLNVSCSSWTGTESTELLSTRAGLEMSI